MTRIKFLIEYILVFLALAAAVACNGQQKSSEEPGGTTEAKSAKFEPEDGKCYVFIGQDLGAVGGLESYNSGYCDTFDTPAGVTVYLGIGNNEETVAGLYETANWGSGDCCADMYRRSERFGKTIVAVGLALVGQEENIVDGRLDGKLKTIGEWMKKMSPRPVFLRIGYEFDGTEWNHYVPDTYIAAYKYIKDYLDRQGLDNVAYVWQSKGYGTTAAEMQKWYPGNEYVDWCAYSYFGQPDKAMIEFARMKQKPVFIAEATPVFQEGEVYFDADIKKEKVARRIWDEWFTGFFKTIEENQDVVKAFSYINVDWLAQPMWIDNVTFQQCDSRIQMSDYVSGHWRKKMSDKRYIQSADLDWNQLTAQ